MSYLLKHLPVEDAQTDEAYFVEGGIAIFHWSDGCNRWVVFTLEELVPLAHLTGRAYTLRCPNCKRNDPVARCEALIAKMDEARAALERL